MESAGYGIDPRHKSHILPVIVIILLKGFDKAGAVVVECNLNHAVVILIIKEAV